MKRCAGMMLLATAALMWTQAAWAEDTVESIEKTVVKQWDYCSDVPALHKAVFQAHELIRRRRGGPVCVAARPR